MMKKTLLLASMLGAAAGAHAQSTVSLMGTVDAGFNAVTGSVSNRTQLNSGGNSTSKLIFRGNEDLGGGMYANFWLESGFLADSGVGQATNTNNQTAGATAANTGLAFNRRSIVGLGGAWGEVHMGREWASTYDSYTARYDLFGVGVGIGLNYTAGLNPSLVRVSNAVGYTTPQFLGGASVNLQHWFGENPSGTATSKDGTGDGIRFNYDKGPYSVASAYSRTRYAAGDVALRVIAAYYDPGPFKIAFNINRDTQGPLTQNGYNVGGLVRSGLNEFKATYSSFRTNAAGNPSAGKLSVGYVYNFSKRTAFYASYARLNNKNGSALAVSGAVTAANQGSTGLDLGIRHNF